MTEQLAEAFRFMVCFRVPEVEDLLVEIDGTRIRTTAILDRCAEAGEAVPLPLPIADLLGLPPGSTYARGVAVYRASIPLPKFPPMAKRGDVTENAFDMQPLDRFSPDRLQREVRQRIRLNGDGEK